MFQQDLEAQEDEDDPAGKLCLGFVFCTENISDPDAESGDHEGRHSDEQDGGDDVYVQECECDAHCQCVDTCGHCQQKHGADIQRAALIVAVTGQCFLDHVRTDDAEQDEGDPVVDRRDLVAELNAEQITDRRHQRLEPAEPRAHDDGPAEGDLRHCKPLTDRDGERVH